MWHREGNNRAEPIRLNLEEAVDAHHPIRIIDAYVDSLDLGRFGFSHAIPAQTGSPPYHPGDLLKLYIYGYENRIRSSRQLEWACKVNIELWWLLKGVKPSYRTIARFRADHPEGLRMLFEHYVKLLKCWGLMGGKTVGIDSVKLRAQNSKKNNYNQKKIERHQKRIVKNIRRYMEEMDEADEEGQPEGWAAKGQALKKISVQLGRLAKYQALEKELAESRQKQLSTTDEDARSLALHRDIVEVCYSAQVAADAKHKLLVHYQATNENDAHALHATAQGEKEALEVKQIDVLADKGYHTGSELAACAEDNMTTYVAPPRASTPGTGPQPGYRMVDFTYVAQGDYYLCPQGYELHTNGRYYQKGSAGYQVKHYKAKACEQCPSRQDCTKNKLGRLIERSQYQAYTDANRRRVEANKAYYLKRQQIIEHPFGTIKRSWGYTYTLLKGKKKVDGELGLIFFCYNLRRSVSILGVEGLLKRLRGLFEAIWRSAAGWYACLGGAIMKKPAYPGAVYSAVARKKVY